ncbi:MAG: hypothetical protein ACPGJI_08230 [Kangiellaceae bacterium]
MHTDLSLLENFECSIYQKNHKQAYQCLIQLLKIIDSTGFQYEKNNLFDSSESARVVATRIMSGFISLLTEKSFKLDFDNYLNLLNVKKNIDSISKVSGFHESNNYSSYLLKQYETATNTRLKQNYLYKLLISMRLEDHSADSLNFLIDLDAKTTLPYVLALLSNPVILNNKAHLVREKLLSFGSILANQTIEFTNTGLLATAWMHSSYGIREDKHLIKSSLNQIMHNTLIKDGFKPPAIKELDSAIVKPKILILAEVFFSQHAMGRCYAKYIIQLKRQFNVVLFASQDSVDEEAISYFDDSIIFDQSLTNIHQISKLISEQQADIVYYPSVGMSTWVISLLTIRFAPIQIATMGHPATTLSDKIDYLVLPQFLSEFPECYSERILTLPNDLSNTHKSILDENFPKPRIKNQTEIIRIAVNGKSFKVNPLLLQTCQEINDRLTAIMSDKSIEWIFFTNEMGILHYHCEYEIKKWLGNAQVLPAQTYEGYLQTLNQCDIALATFPFGGSNSIIDLLRLGIPLVYLTGKEAHSRCEEMFCGYFDLIEGLACKTTEQVCANLVRLIENDDYRVQLCQKILKKDASILLITPDIKLKTDLVDTFLWVWKNHSSVLEKDLKFISYKDRL